MEQLLPYQGLKKPIVDKLKLQLNQNIALSTIVQVTIERARNILNLDRLVVYQLDTGQVERYQNKEPVKTVNRVTYEVKASEQIESILNFQSNPCQHSQKQCWTKYRQGFSLAINDIKNSNLAPELRLLMEKLGVKSKVVVPINLKDKLWGLLIAHQCDDVRIWDYHDTQFLRQIAEYLAIAIYQSQSYENLHRQKKLLEEQVKNQAQQIENALVAARVASQSKHEFLGNISHELRTPLTRVIGLSETLLHWSLEEGRNPLPVAKQQQYLKTIQDSGKHLLKLINTILEFSEVQSGKQLLNPETIFLFDFAQEIINSLQALAKDSGLTLYLDFKLSPKASYFYGDRIKLQEIIYNLLDNAIKFTPENGIICLRIWQENKELIFEVEDTGIGISEQQLPLLFETFKPLENFRQRIHEGVGIGLILTKHLVELHGGNIEVESTQGEGSSFRVYFPISSVNYSPHKRSNFALKTTNNELNKVVLITQDEAIAASICELLTAANYKVVWLIDTLTAINQIDFLDPHIVILDRDNLALEIPDVYNALKTIESIDAKKMLLLYSQMQHQEWHHFLEKGFCDRIMKSQNLSHLIEKIEALI